MGMAGLLAAALVRCSTPPLPPGPQAFATDQRVVRGAVLALPGDPVDRAALVASLKELAIDTVILKSAASPTAASLAERAALAVELEGALSATVLLGTYEAPAFDGRPMAALLQKDPAFDRCYPEDGARLDPSASVIDKLRLCSAEVAKRLAGALGAANASARVGCFVAHEPALADSLTADEQAGLNQLLREAAGPCVEAGRPTAVAVALPGSAADPERAGATFRESLRDSQLARVILRDGVGAFEPTRPRRAASFYVGLKNALTDRQAPYGPVQIWADVEAFDCEGPGCTRSHPADAGRYAEQLCAARARVDGIVTFEYLHHLAGRPLFPGAVDASASVQAIDGDRDAATQLREGYLAWRDAGAPCPPR
jgi:hypothetical protein